MNSTGMRAANTRSRMSWACRSIPSGTRTSSGGCQTPRPGQGRRWEPAAGTQHGL